MVGKGSSRHTLIHYIVEILLALTIKTALAIFFSGVTYLGYLVFFLIPSPFNLILGMALVLIGLSMALVSLWEIWAPIVSWNYSRTHCPFCADSKDPKEILSLRDGRPA